MVVPQHLEHRWYMYHQCFSCRTIAGEAQRREFLYAILGRATSNIRKQYHLVNLRQKKFHQHGIELEKHALNT